MCARVMVAMCDADKGKGKSRTRRQKEKERAGIDPTAINLQLKWLIPSNPLIH